MENDERDERQDRQEPERRDLDQDRDLSADQDEADQAEAEEFETAAWPQQDSLRGAELHQPPAEEPYAAEVPPDEIASAEASEERSEEAAAQPAAAGWTAEPELPPSEAEAYAAPPEAAEEGLPAHSVPATEPGESTRCPRCGEENRPGVSFCRNCGQRLVAAGAPATVARPAPPEGTQACPRCGTHNRAGVAFCQNCGANLRAAGEGYVPPAVAAEEPVRAATEPAVGRALLGPVVLVIGAVGLVTAWLLPFLVGEVSLYDQSFGRSDGYGLAFWRAYDGIGTLAEQAYFGFAAPAPILVVLLLVLAVAGFLRPAPAILQLIGLVVALVWAIGLVALFFSVEVFGGPGGELLDMLRALSPGGIIFMLASLIVVIGALTRLGRG